MDNLKILVIDNIFMLGKMFGSGIGVNADFSSNLILIIIFLVGAIPDYIFARFEGG